MRVTILGCGGSAGVPSIGGSDGRGDWGRCDPAEPRNRRSRSSIVLEGPTGERLLVDTGPELRAQLLDSAVPKIDAVLYTHAHADHITGIDEVRILNRLCGHPLDAYGTAYTLDEIEHRFDYAFRPWTPPHFFRPVLVRREVLPGDVLQVAGLSLTLFEQDHKVVKTLGLRCGDFAYSTDLVELSQASLAMLDGVDTWLVGCFQRQPHLTHASLARVLGWSRQLGVRRTVLTHMGFDMDWAWLEANLPPGVEPAHDTQTLTF